MKNSICTLLLLSATLACCRAQPDPDHADLAATMAGSWNVDDCWVIQGISGSCTGSLVLTRIDATHLKGDVRLSTGSPFSDTCTLTITSKDTLFGLPGSPGYYRQGKIYMSFGDASMNVRFAKN